MRFEFEFQKLLTNLYKRPSLLWWMRRHPAAATNWLLHAAAAAYVT